ncbi:MAG: BadF/BadG/BcrA/BcrD ATPase family protein [Sulfitobacter sp.]
MKNLDDKVLVAADGGGTGCRAAAGTFGNGIMARSAGGPGNVHSDFDEAILNLVTAIDAALQDAGLGDTPRDQITAHLGVAGAHSDVEMAAVERALPYGKCRVTGDRATSLRGALGDSDGYVVALGTGTIVARQNALEMTTIGGWGFDLSDHASGSWLGHRLLREVLLAEEGLIAHTPLTRKAIQDKGGLLAVVYFSMDAAPGDYAPLARDVVAAAAQDDPIALQLMRDGAEFLELGLRTLGHKAGDKLVLTGGLGPHYAPYLAQHLTDCLIPPKGTALEGAFALAQQAAKTTV